jgi:hypothetical protein
MQIAWPSGVGALVALLVIVVAVVLVIVGQLDLWPIGAGFIALGVARLT